MITRLWIPFLCSVQNVYKVQQILVHEMMEIISNNITRLQKAKHSIISSQLLHEDIWLIAREIKKENKYIDKVL